MECVEWGVDIIGGWTWHFLPQYHSCRHPEQAVAAGCPQVAQVGSGSGSVMAASSSSISQAVVFGLLESGVKLITVLGQITVMMRVICQLQPNFLS